MKDRIKMTVSEEVILQQVLQQLDLEQLNSLQEVDQEDPFADYLWMENEEEFNQQVEEQLREEDFIERCFQEMFEEEEQDCFIPSRDLPAGQPGSAVDPGQNQISSSTLNPHAREFIPGMPQHVM